MKVIETIFCFLYYLNSNRGTTFCIAHTSFAKKDISQFIDDVITDYCASDNILDDRKFDFINNFEMDMRKDIKAAKKKDVPEILNKAINELQELDPELPRVMSLNLRKNLLRVTLRLF